MKMLNARLCGAAAALSLVLAVVPASRAAEGENPLSFGVLLGGAFQPNLKNHFAYGVELDYKVHSRFSVGLSGMFNRLDDTTVSLSIGNYGYQGTVQRQMSFTLLHGFYHIEEAPGFYAGAQVGIASKSVYHNIDIPNGTDVGLLAAKTSFTAGPVVGYDFMLMDHLSIGAQLNYLFASFDEMSQNSFNAFGVIKARF